MGSWRNRRDRSDWSDPTDDRLDGSGGSDGSRIGRIRRMCFGMGVMLRMIAAWWLQAVIQTSGLTVLQSPEGLGT